MESRASKGRSPLVPAAWERCGGVRMACVRRATLSYRRGAQLNVVYRKSLADESIFERCHLACKEARGGPRPCVRIIPEIAGIARDFEHSAKCGAALRGNAQQCQRPLIV